MTETAWVDLSKIIDGIAGVSLSGRNVNKWATKILTSIKSLTVFPNGGKEFYFDNRYKTKRAGRYVIIYQVLDAENKVYIHRVVYGGRDFSRLEIKK